MKLQITLTVPEAKRVIAKSIVNRDDVKQAIKSGKILLKGGTTVSAISDELVGQKLRIGGRISPRGTMNTLKKYDQHHSALIENGKFLGIDKTIGKVTGSLEKDDVIIVSANAIDIHGDAAMMAAAPLGHNPGKAMAGFASQGCKVIIAAGLEKLIPGRISDAIQSCGRTIIDKSMGAAIGLIPLIGEIVTEKEALEGLAEVSVTVIGAGGIHGAEGSTTLVVDGPESEVERILEIVLSIKGTETSGTPESLIECEGGCPQCPRHLACIYKNGEDVTPKDE
ncbi:MAG: hypothetical protein ACXACD_01335 [Candidatus Thorarchaeota archaeon]|jgi:hypothetical protein